MGTGIALGGLNPQAGVFQAKEDQLINQLKSPESMTDAKIDKASTDFEAILVGNWLQQAEKSFATLPGTDDDDDKDVASDNIMNFGVEALSKSLAASGGIGIGKMIAKAMHKQVDNSNTKGLAETGEKK
jgi:Rod binding domain-containing protein